MNRARMKFAAGFVVGLAISLAVGLQAQVGGPVIGQAKPTGTFSGTTVTATTAFRAPDGTEAIPGYGFTAASSWGLWRDTNYGVATTVGGTSSFAVGTTNAYLPSGSSLSWTSGTFAGVTTPDLNLSRDAAATLAQKNATVAQSFRLYGTTTGPKYLSIGHDGTNGVIDTAASSGTVSIAPTNATAVTIGKATTIATSITSSTATFPITGLAASAGGSVSLIGGAGATTTGGAVAITGGAATSGAGSSITITAGAAAGGTNAGGDVNLVPTVAVSTGTPGEVKINSARGFFEACWQQYLPASVPVSGSSYTFFMANRAYRVVAASAINSSTSTVPTVDVFKDSGTNAPGAGATTLTGVMTFSGTANTRVTGTPSATVTATNLAAGDRLSAKFAGTVGSITGAIVCVTLVPI